MTIEHQAEQGSAEFYRLRLGIPTASCFDRIITPKTGRLSATSRKYAYQLIAERLLNKPMQSLDGVQYIERGKELEPEAVKQYEFQTDIETRPCGFFTTDDGLIGATPDRIWIGKPGALEAKCPAAHTHIAYLLDGPEMDKYKAQVQGQIFVAELEQVDLYSYHPRCPPALIRSYRDDAFIGLMKSALDEFNARLFEMMERCKALGIFQAFEEVRTPAELAYDPNLRSDPLATEEELAEIIEGRHGGRFDWGG